MRKLFTLRYLLVLLFFGVLNMNAIGQTNPSPQSLPYTQNFSSFTGSTTTFPPGIQGWGFGTAALSTSFNTTAPTADQALIGANNASTSGFVGDMNGKIGLLSTGTAIKAICLSIKTTSLSNISVSFIAATQRQQISNRVGELGVQYRIGTSGPFTNIAGSTYQNDVLTDNITGNGGINPATISFSLPAACENQSEVQIRWIQRDVSGSGNRPGFSVTNISITGTAIVSSNANLSNLILNAGSLTPSFATATTSYTTSVPNSVASIKITPTASDGSATIKVNGSTVASGNASASIPLNVGENTITTVVTASDLVTAKTYTVTITRFTASTPALTVTSPLPDFGNICTNSTSGFKSFTIDGNSLNGTDINITALPGFLYSETSGGTYTNTLNFSYTGGNFTGKVIYVKFNPGAVQSYNGDIALSGGGANSNVAVTGYGVNSTPSLTTGNSSSITATTATATGAITANGCTAITVYGIEFSTNSGFPDGTGTQLLSSNLSGGNFSVNLTGLTPNTKYYYKAFTTNNGGTSYGVQQAFTCTPLPVKLSMQPDLTFTENFSDIANWGSFFSVGNGANHWGGLSAATGSGIPNPVVITSATTSFLGATSGSSGGIQKGMDQAVPAESMVFLSTGSPDNTTSTAIDFYMDFTGVNASTLSFDYTTLNNSTGDRNGSLRVYSTVDGITFTELTFAGVLNFTNNVPVSGSKINIALPASFDNNPTARLRFYYHNGSGGTGTGSRPKISIDNLTITAVATTPCVTPTVPATTLAFGAIDDVSVEGSFTGSGMADNYIVVMSTSNSLTSNPVDGQIYNLGDNVGDGTIVYKGSATSFTATGLSASTNYFFFVFPLNSVCTGGPLYNTTDVLTGQVTTAAGLSPCAAPSAQPSNLLFGTVGVNSIQGSFNPAPADGYLILCSQSASLTTNPVDGQAYNAGSVIGNATVIQRSNAATFTVTGLQPGTQYYFFIFSLNSQSCINGPAYYTNTPLASSQTTMPLPACASPSSQPGVLNFASSNTLITGSFTPVNDADNYLVVRSLAPTLSSFPVDNTDYSVGDVLGGGIVVSNNSSNSFITKGLTSATTYYFYIFASNRNCSGGTKYLIVNPLTGNKATTNAPLNNYYFGNLHSHSDYSDGNQDNLGGTPAISYDYAKTALCMDYLGISEHNHFSSTKNPGNRIATYHLGSQQADSFTVANPGFLALYGMEWGVISGGGHVVIYGDKMDDLFGWESGSGGWGPASNYDVYVPKNTYTGPSGLFKTINDYAAKNTFATLAHPNLTDYNNLAGSPYDLVADNAISGTAVESGPATSNNKTYSNPGSSLYYLSYFQTLLSKGYHLGPTIDHDNHNTTFGHTTYSRTAIIAPALTKTEIVKAMKNRHFYATQDCDSKVDFSINTQIMGSVITDRYAPNISVTLTDATTPIASAKIRLMYGVPGSGSLPVVIDSVIGDTYHFTDNALTNGSTGYYYVDITNGTARIITSPIWYTRNDNFAPLPVKLNAFSVQKSGKAVKLMWATQQETKSRHFIIERSADGISWKGIQIVSAAGNSTHHTDYTAYDNSPLIGINYYRLQQVDIDGKLDYSPVKNVVFNSQYQVSVSPNPATDFVNITLAKNDFSPVTIEMIDVAGKVVNHISTSQTLVQLKVNNLSKGTYIIKITDRKGITTQKLVIQ